MTRIIFDERLDEVAVDELTEELVRHIELYLNQELNVTCLSLDSDKMLNKEFKLILSKFFGLQ